MIKVAKAVTIFIGQAGYIAFQDGSGLECLVFIHKSGLEIASVRG